MKCSGEANRLCGLISPLSSASSGALKQLITAATLLPQNFIVKTVLL
jgi:hypothetical protein